MSWIRQTPEGVVLSVRLTPRASRNEVQGVGGDALRLRLQAPPVDGKANEALRRFLADALRVAPSRIALLAGETNRNKRVGIAGVTVETVTKALGVRPEG